MAQVFPSPIADLPQADLPIPGAVGYMLQGQNEQALFMEFPEDRELPAHAHAAQWGIVVEGHIRLVIDGVPHDFYRGDRYVIPEGVVHSGFLFAGSAVIDFFADPARYHAK